MSRLGLRRRLLLVVLATVALVIAGLVAGFNVLLSRTLDGDARDLVRSHAAAQVASLRIDHGRLSVGEAPDGRSSDAYVWVFSGARPLERPNTGAAIDRAARGLAAGPARFVDVAKSMEGAFDLFVDAVEAAFVVGRLVDRDTQQALVVPPSVAFSGSHGGHCSLPG